ncbi:GhoT/OrtT family toxin, partial [Escherichia coli]|nr:GhoT/OrtT family toxin [Escherichia coli]
MINKLLLAYLIGLVVTSTLIFIFSEEKVTYRLFAAAITGLTSVLEAKHSLEVTALLQSCFISL